MAPSPGRPSATAGFLLTYRYLDEHSIGREKRNTLRQQNCGGGVGGSENSLTDKQTKGDNDILNDWTLFPSPKPDTLLGKSDIYPSATRLCLANKSGNGKTVAVQYDRST